MKWNPLWLRFPSSEVFHLPAQGKKIYSTSYHTWSGNRKLSSLAYPLSTNTKSVFHHVGWRQSPTRKEIYIKASLHSPQSTLNRYKNFKKEQWYLNICNRLLSYLNIFTGCFTMKCVSQINLAYVILWINFCENFVLIFTSYTVNILLSFLGKGLSSNVVLVRLYPGHRTPRVKAWYMFLPTECKSLFQQPWDCSEYS